MAFNATNPVTVGLATKKDHYDRAFDNTIALREGGVAIASQAALDFIHASSATQLARVAAVASKYPRLNAAGSAWEMEQPALSQTFRGLTLRTHPDADVAASKVYLDHADEIVMHDGTRVADWDDLTADLTASGPNGLDTGTEGASRWYEIHAIRKSSDGTKGLLLHRAKDYALDQSNTTTNGDVGFRDVAAHTTLAQRFVAGANGQLPFVDLKWSRSGTISGRVWLTLESESAGNPSGVALATSDKLDANLIASTSHVVRHVFRSPYTLVSGTAYYIVARGDFAIGVNSLLWRSNSTSVYASGFLTQGDAGGAYTAAGGGTYDGYFVVYVTQNYTAVTMPSGYDQRAHVGWVYNNSSSDFNKFSACDRHVTTYPASAVVTTGSATISTLLDLSSMAPPVPVTLEGLLVAQTTAGSTAAFTPRLGVTDDNYAFFTGAGAYYVYIYAGLHVEFQHMFYYVSGGAVTAFVPVFRW